jgi:hypothetical protein
MRRLQVRRDPQLLVRRTDRDRGEGARAEADDGRAAQLAEQAHVHEQALLIREELLPRAATR